MKTLSVFLFTLILSVNIFAKKSFSIKKESFTLKNGLKVFLIPREDSKIVSIQLYYSVGAVNEKNSVLGIAHFLEHMMFKTSKNLKAGEYSYKIKSRGGYDNAATSYEYTTYYNVLPANELELGLKLEAERMHNLTFLKKEFDSEKKVVLEEKANRYENSPMGYLWTKANLIFFKNHPYGRPIIGTDKSIANINIKAMKAFYKKNYSPSNSILLVCGNFKLKSIKKLIAKYFEKIPSQNQHRKIAVKNYIATKGTFSFQKKTRSRYAMQFRKIPSVESRLTPAFLLLDYILFEGKSSLAKKELIYKKRLCYTLGGGAFLRKMPSAYLLHFIPSGKHSFKEVITAWQVFLKSLLKKDLSQNLKRARLFLLTDFYKDLQNVKSVTSTIGWGSILKSPTFLFELYQKAGKVSEKELKEAILYLIKSPSANFLLTPKK